MSNLGPIAIPVIAQLTEILAKPMVAESWRRYPGLWARVRQYIRMAMADAKIIIAAMRQEMYEAPINVVVEGCPMLVD